MYEKIIIGVIAAGVIVAGIFGAGRIYSNVTNSSTAEGVDYSKYYAYDGDMEKITENTKEKIIEVGKNIAITQTEVEQYEKFYKQKGEKNAEEKAISYAEERNVLYVKAIENGYDVTDEEVYAYLDKLKAMLQEESNQEMYRSAMKDFSSEDDYWAYEFTVYKIDLPIQKYNEAMEEAYREKQI